MMLPKLAAGVSRGLARDASEQGAQPSADCCVWGFCQNADPHRGVCTDAHKKEIACARGGYAIAASCQGAGNIREKFVGDNTWPTLNCTPPAGSACAR